MAEHRDEPLAAPHEILGLPPEERDPVRIVEAAEIRLEAVQKHGGTQWDVRETVESLIQRARDMMLRTLATD